MIARNAASYFAAVLLSASPAFAQAEQAVVLTQDDARGMLTATLDGQELFRYNYGDEVDLPHYFPLNTPTGKNLLVQKTQPYPHHRAFWVSDTVERNGVKGDVYNGYYSGVKQADKTYLPPYRSGSRHVSFELTTASSGLATIHEKLVWETGRPTATLQLLDETRTVRVVPLENGAYLMDFSFSLTATYGDVKFISDAVHYSWPYLRINSQFSVEGGGTLTDDKGTTGQAATNLRPALWIDYSNTVDGVTEGVAMFQYPDGNAPRKWLTRDYGTFGPRRPDHQSGKPFVLKKGDRLSQRVGVYVHSGDVTSGRVAETYQRYVRGEW